MNLSDIKIDPEFRDKIPPLTEDEFKQLRENILADGEVREPLVIWNGVILDGHNRFKVLQEHPEIPFRVKEKDFPDKWAASEWICRNQLGRRNLTKSQRQILIGTMLQSRKKAHGASDGFRGNQSVRDQNGLLPNHPHRTAEAIAKELGVGITTVKRAEKYKDGVKDLEEIAPDAADKVRQDKGGVPDYVIREFPKMSKSEKLAVVDRIRNPPPKSHGGTKEIRQTYSMIDKIVDQLYGNREEVEHTIDDLIEEIVENGRAYENQLRHTIANKSFLLKDEEARKAVRSTIDGIVSDIMKVRDLV